MKASTKISHMDLFQKIVEWNYCKNGLYVTSSSHIVVVQQKCLIELGLNNQLQAPAESPESNLHLTFSKT